MREFYRDYVAKNWWFHAFSIIAICLIIASFIVPPTGVIDSSVLAAVGEIFAFASLGALIKAIDKGIDAKVKHGDTELHVINDSKESLINDTDKGTEE